MACQAQKNALPLILELHWKKGCGGSFRLFLRFTVGYGTAGIGYEGLGTLQCQGMTDKKKILPVIFNLFKIGEGGVFCDRKDLWEKSK